MDSELIELDREVRFRKVFGVTHEEYLDEPRAHASWLLAVAELEP